ncbi:MAG: hypothetical protein QOF21_1571 [Actinomycetota bacterium]
MNEVVLVAALLEDRAGRVEAMADTLAARAAAATWAGPAADRFRLLMVERRGAMRAGAMALRDAAHALRMASAQ